MHWHIIDCNYQLLVTLQVRQEVMELQFVQPGK
jgi:hypothetical protein